MAKLWPSLSVLLVLAMLLFLVPTLVLLPGQSVSAGDEPVVQEVESTFTFSEDAPGDWRTFTAGSGSIQGAGLCLEQFTREYVLLQSTLAGCGFRNYTTGSGGVTGDLTGAISLAWSTFNFSQKYPNAAALYHDYGSTAHFGFMTGRGHFYATDPNDNFTFVFVLDVDSDETLTNAEGKGFMVSIEENGIFGDMSLPVEQRHKIIGDFDVLKSGADYTWNLHLRNYAPNEVYYKGDVEVEGGVMQEFTDPIHAPVALVNFTQDGPDVTPSDLATGFEEINWGKDPFKNITAGPLGINGLMDITRNGALYLRTNATHVHIQAMEMCILHIDDTIAQTGDDGSTYGHTYYYLALTLPYQVLPIGEMFVQDGYTWYPFGMYLSPTDWYDGAETFAQARIWIESAIGNAVQTSLDKSYGLCPHPKVESVTSNVGSPNTTKNVIIAGKYFLRAAGEKSGWVANSGSVDFGDGITVNSYTINDATNPIDNSITASITIAADAPAGKRNVTVTSCFGYSNGNGTEPYKTGTLVDGFEVVAAGGSLAGHVDLQGMPATDITVRFFDPDTTNEAMKEYGTTDGSGDFIISGLTPGTYDVAVKGQTSLSNLVTGVDLSVPGTRDFGVLLEGDVDNDDYVDPSDFAMLSYCWLSYPGQPNWDASVDFSRDDYIDPSDFALLSYDWLKWGDCYGWSGNWN